MVFIISRQVRRYTSTDITMCTKQAYGSEETFQISRISGKWRREMFSLQMTGESCHINY